MGAVVSTRLGADATTVLLIVDDVIIIIINNEIKDRKVGKITLEVPGIIH